jgi:hypothetical protein
MIQPDPILSEHAGTSNVNMAMGGGRPYGREHNYIARIETGQRRLDLVELVQLCRACNADPEHQIARITRGILSLVPRKRAAIPPGRRKPPKKKER